MHKCNDHTVTSASEYERRHEKSLEGFFDSSIPYIKHPEVGSWGASLLQERSLHGKSE